MRAVLIGAFLAFAAGQTAYAASPCPAAAGEIKQVLPGADRAEFFAGLSASFLLGLDPAAFPRNKIAAQTDPCTRGEFEVGGQTYVVHGTDDHSPPRWAASKDSGKIAFLALMPPPLEALKWARSQNRSNSVTFSGSGIYAVVVTDGGKRDIYALLEAPPGDAQLVALFRQVLDGSLKPFARYDTATGETKVVRQ